MTHSQALAHAGGNDSQDSQAIFEAYTAEFGVATLGSSPPKACFPVGKNANAIQLSLSDAEIEHSSSNAAARDALAVGARRAAQGAQGPAEVGDPPHWAGLAATGMALTPQKQYGSRKKAAAPAPDVKDNHVAASTNHANSNAPYESRRAVFTQPSLPRHEPARPKQALDAALKRPNYGIKPPPPPVRRMEFSQQTPTQVNNDRDYSEYCSDIVPSSPVDETTQPASNNPQTLDGDDAGAVNFGLSEIPRPSSQVSEDAGFENTRGDWRRPEETPQVGSSHAFTPYKAQDAAFETPALPKNPFAARGSVAAPLAGSQLFGQSQFSSAVKKAISPTSSRPSPNLFNSISPGIIETSPLKNRANVSSPTDIRTSSPQRLDEVPDTSLRDKDDEPDEARTPLHSRSTGGEMIPESPTSPDRTPKALPPKSPPRSSDNGPKTHYIPMKKSQERKSHTEALVSPLDSDSDSDSIVKRIERKKKIERKRAQAAEEMGRVSFTPRARQGSGEPPSRKKRRVMSTGSTVMGPTTHEAEPSKPRDDSAPPVLSTSQDVITASNETALGGSTKATPGESSLDDKEELDNEGDTLMQDTLVQDTLVQDTLVQMDMEKRIIEEDVIPATSPAPSMPATAPQDSAPLPPTEPDLPTLPDEVEGETREEEDENSSSLPLQRRNRRTYGRDGRQRRRNPFISSSVNSDAIVADQEPKPQPVSSALESAVPSSPTPEEPPVESSVLKVDSPAKPSAPRRATRRSPRKQQELPPPMTTRSRRSDAGPSTPLVSRSAGEPMPTSSSLSMLSTTPVPSSKTTPGTQESPLSERPGSVSLPSPAKARGSRKRDAQGGTKSESPQPVTRATRMAKRMPRLDSESTDELHHSPSASALEKSLIYSKSNRSFRQSIGQVQRSGRLFEGMVFAISFSSKFKPQERTKLEAKITQAGGTVLPEGFQHMFEPSMVMNTNSPIIDDEDPLTLTKSSADCGFTALLGDSHSRKAKYMQALALGLPCLAHQWITTCLSKGAIVDWEPYVLCAGVSAVLGDAIRSRMLTPYSAAEARLADVVDQRPRLLDGQRILVVVDSRKARNEAKEPYIFLARVLGPSISRVFTVQQAREVLQEHQKAGDPFDWLYIDKGTGTVDAVLAPQDAPVGKRRRKSAPVIPSTFGNIRVLDDELVIQSLILGRMVEADERHF